MKLKKEFQIHGIQTQKNINENNKNQNWHTK